MIILPAIDMYDKKAVRLFKGDYSKMTVYSDDPVEIARDFKRCGAEFIHLVDLEGAKDGTTPNIDVVERIIKETGLKAEIGGGIRSKETLERYLSIGVSRVILGTAAVTDREFLIWAVKNFGEKIAVGADIKDGFVAIKGWLEKSEIRCEEFFLDMEKIGVKTIICTDISKDGAMQGTNRSLYKELSQKFSIDIVASGGVSSLDDISALKEMQLYGAIVGKAYYIKAIDLEEAIRLSR
ncbi:MAG: 1-(5-phosphoribosyl)-5-[(5-phosphoribosylamino)methylideneamino]imidazole-4-carboxamide isomerase [Ruminococcaceae bacterium]|nr:1-(5-phosphoribosyl)-5-[(5-phosphoribosylamino)methylideneamino]imidazole-4-carboxamide isomerase [Oscillospiraceae bacterium]